MRETQTTAEEVRERLQRLLDEYHEIETELRKLEESGFRVCLFGSARIRPHDRMYQEIYRLARALASHGMDIVTGGGPGLMEAANRGVRDACNARSRSYGLPITLPPDLATVNEHLDIKSEHKRFSSRLDEFMRLSHAVVIAPGGIGTLLELFYVWQLLQVGHIERRPVVLLGKRFWKGLLDWVRVQPLESGLVSPDDLDWVTTVDTVDEVVEIVSAEQLRLQAFSSTLSFSNSRVAKVSANAA